MKDIKVGYLEPIQERGLGDVIVNNFLNLLARYVNLTFIPVDKQEGIKASFRRIEKYKPDYIYIDSFNYLFERFLLREKFGLDTPFIFTLHMVTQLIDQYVFSLPLIRKYDIILAPSRYAKESFLRISDRAKVHVIPYFLDMNFIQENIPHNFKKDGKTITFMGRLVKQKGIATLIECIPEIISKLDDVHLNIIGPLSGIEITDRSKSVYVKELERRIKELRLTNRVHFKGVQLGLDKYRLLSESDIFINPTLALEETFGVVNIEALACGIPIIATNWAANKEIIIEGKNGFLVDVNYDQDKNPKIDTKQLVSLIVKVLKDEKLRLKMRRDSLKTALNYNYRKVIPKLLSLLKKKVTIGVENKWDSIKNRRVIDFRQFFNKKSFFFISLIYFFRKFTYGSLYEHIFGRVSLKRTDSSTNRKNIRRGEAKNIEITKRLRQEYKDFLLLKR